MRVWLEYPESTRYARYHADIDFTPIFFANEGISGYLCFENDAGSQDSITSMDASITLTGAVELGFFKLGLGFRAIYRIKILTYEQNVSLIPTRTPFTFILPTHSLDEIQQLASSLKVISSDTASTIPIATEVTPAMMVSVRYTLEARVTSPTSSGKKDQEIRLFSCFDEAHLPPPPLFSHVISEQSTTIPNKLSLFRNKNHRTSPKSLAVETFPPPPLTFQLHSDAAATKVRLVVTITDSSPTPLPPTTMHSTLEWLLISLTSLTAKRRRPSSPTDGPPPPDTDTFHLRTKLLPSRKLKLKWSNWTSLPPDSYSSAPRWQSMQDVWITESFAAGLTPTFETPYIEHSYSLTLKFRVAGDSKIGGAGAKVELMVPLAIRYDVGLAPCYTIDRSLPEYEFEVAPVGEQRDSSDNHNRNDNDIGSSSGNESDQQEAVEERIHNTRGIDE